MGWKPEPRWDKSAKRYRVTIRSQRHWLGREWGEALRKCGDLLAESGIGGPRERPVYISELVLAHRGPTPTEWQKYITGEWATFCGLTARLDELHLDALHDFKHHLETLRRLGPQTTRHMLSHAIRTLKWAHLRGYVNRLPELPKLPAIPDNPKHLSDDQLIKCWKYFKPKRRQRARTIFDFLLITGLRPSKARLLKWSEIRYDSDPPHVYLAPNRHKNGKRSGKPKRTSLNDEALEVLEEARQRDPSQPWVFLTRLRKPYTKGGLHTVFEPAGVTPYSLRHTFGQSALDQLKDVFLVGELLGHTDKQFRTVRTYARIKGERIAQATQDLVSAKRRLLDATPPAVSVAGDQTKLRKAGRPTPPRSAKRRAG